MANSFQGTYSAAAPTIRVRRWLGVFATRSRLRLAGIATGRCIQKALDVNPTVTRAAAQHAVIVSHSQTLEVQRIIGTTKGLWNDLSFKLLVGVTG